MAVIATDVPGTRELVVNEKTGYLIQPNDIASLADSINRLIRDGLLRDRLGNEGAKLIEQKFDEKLVVARLTEVYLGLLKKKEIKNI